MGASRHHGCNQAVKMQAGNESHGFPVTAGSVIMASLSHRTAAMPPGHVRACSRFIEKDQARGVTGLLPVPPDTPCCCHVSTFLLAGPQCFFIAVSQRADKPVNGGDVDTNPQSLFNPVLMGLLLCALSAQFDKDFATSIKPGNPAFSKTLLSDQI